MAGEAQRRAPIQRLADLIAAYFVQVVVVIAVVTALVWTLFGPEPAVTYALVNAVAVLIIACPCAVGLATPISMTVAMGQGALSGILFRNAEAIERMREIDTLVVDKTGTLTLGHPARSRTLSPRNCPSARRWRSLPGQQQPEHPIARAIVDGAKARGAAPAQRRTSMRSTGSACARAMGGRCWSAAARFSRTRYRYRPLGEPIRRLARTGEDGGVLLVDGQARGMAAVADPIKDTTPRRSPSWKWCVRIVMLTGDGKRTGGGAPTRH